MKWQCKEILFFHRFHMTKKEFISCGIDVSKEKLDVALLTVEGEIKHFIVANTEDGIQKIMKQLEKFQEKIIMESTGRYHLLCALLLHQAEYKVFVINPLISSKYFKASVRKHKTDKIDATKLAEIGILEKNLVEFQADKRSIEVRQKIGLIASLEKQLQTLQAILKGYSESQKKLQINPSTAEKSIFEEVKNLKKLIEKLEKEIEQKCVSMKGKKQKILVSIPGISNYGAALILQFFKPGLKSPKQWIAYSGLDISTKQSGKWKGHGRLSKRGNSYLRKRLFSIGWGAMMNDERFKKYGETLKMQGRKYREIVVMIARKIIRIAYILLKKNELYNEKIAFPS